MNDTAHSQEVAGQSGRVHYKTCRMIGRAIYRVSVL